jgi:hypothetical protein
MDLLMSDGAILLLAMVGITTTAVSIIRDARAQRARVQTEEVPVEIRAA